MKHANIRKALKASENVQNYEPIQISGAGDAGQHSTRVVVRMGWPIPGI